MPLTHRHFPEPNSELNWTSFVIALLVVAGMIYTFKLNQ